MNVPPPREKISLEQWIHSPDSTPGIPRIHHRTRAALAAVVEHGSAQTIRELLAENAALLAERETLCDRIRNLEEMYRNALEFKLRT